MKCKQTRSRYYQRASQHTATVTNWPGHSWVTCRRCTHSNWHEGTLAPGLHVSLTCERCGKRGEVWVAHRTEVANPDYVQYQKATALGRAR
jgi:transcription elongation factor Elf1